ncbi:Ionotropic receptor 873 [Blattella germanica]|nr:Ionotropic receptor 873 [Blattella germanica]
MFLSFSEEQMENLTPVVIIMVISFLVVQTETRILTVKTDINRRYYNIYSHLDYIKKMECVFIENIGSENISDIFSLTIQYIQETMDIPMIVLTPKSHDVEISHSSGCVHLVFLNHNITLSENTENNGSNYDYWDPRSKYIFIVSNAKKLSEDDIFTIFEWLWQTHKIIRVRMLTIYEDYSTKFYNTEMKIWKYDPFKKELNNVHSVSFNRGNHNLNGQPIRVSMFIHYPTSYFPNSLKGNITSLTNANDFHLGKFLGVDGQMLFNIATFLNFTPKILRYTREMSFGFLLKNGTYTGALGQIVFKHADIAFNSRFIKQYNTTKIEYTRIILNDQVCIIVPKANLIPRWRRMLLSFNTQLWMILLCTCFLIVIFWHILRKINKYKRAEWFIICETFQMLLLSGILHPPKKLSERCFYASCLIFFLVITNAFQSFLVTNITYPNYEPDINTLEELDNSNLPIWSRSQDNADIFRDLDIPVMERLLKKFSVFNGTGNQLLKHVSNIKDAAAIVRATSSPYTESTYVAEDGSQLIHTVDECPASYQLSYIVPKGSPYLPVFNMFILRMNEGGFTDKWHKDGIRVRSLKGEKHGEREALKVFTIEDLQLSFYIYVSGVFASTVVFIAELLI